MPAQLHRVHPLDLVHQPTRVVRRPEVERHAQQVEPALAGGVAHRVECVGELGLDTAPARTDAPASAMSNSNAVPATTSMRAGASSDGACPMIIGHVL